MNKFIVDLRVRVTGALTRDDVMVTVDEQFQTGNISIVQRAIRGDMIRTEDSQAIRVRLPDIWSHYVVTYDAASRWLQYVGDTAYLSEAGKDACDMLRAKFDAERNEVEKRENFPS